MEAAGAIGPVLLGMKNCTHSATRQQCPRHRKHVVTIAVIDAQSRKQQ